ncbi:hypothetical protein [Mesorhizobium sp. M1136]|uniref:hypothetical protein n=1 Tax=unclassified Mesorhizobium TaxID=325217 RepID=UPI00333714C8
MLLLPAVAPRAQSGTTGAATVYSRPYVLSDELGGFRLGSATGSGTKADPLAVNLELLSASPVTLTIRALVPFRGVRPSGEDPMEMMYFHVSTLNNSGLAWIEFEFELQEILGKASVFSDGLSFDQRRTETKTIYSDRFAQFSRDFEPYDRLLFRDGRVDPLETVSFSFLVTDFTPRDKIYLVLDPRIPTS